MGLLKYALMFAAAVMVCTVLRLAREQQKSYGCEMTYMYPAYEPISDAQLEHSSYRLFLYREQTIHHAGGPAVARCSASYHRPSLALERL
jgi:hypothetical protein